MGNDDRTDLLGTVVVQRFGTGAEGDASAILTICDAPTFGLIRADGHHFDWRQDLTRPATTEEALAYWRERALNAEKKSGK